MAEALDCEVRYTLVPKKGLHESLYERAEKLYQKDMQAIDHQMDLEGQGTQSDHSKDLEIAFLIASRDKRLWEEE